MVSDLSNVEKLRQFNQRFLLALDCYIPSVALKLLRDCREDIKMFGFPYAQKKWEQFIVNSLTGGLSPGILKVVATLESLGVTVEVTEVGRCKGDVK